MTNGAIEHELANQMCLPFEFFKIHTYDFLNVTSSRQLLRFNRKEEEEEERAFAMHNDKHVKEGALNPIVSRRSTNSFVLCNSNFLVSPTPISLGRDLNFERAIVSFLS